MSRYLFWLGWHSLSPSLNVFEATMGNGEERTITVTHDDRGWLIGRVDSLLVINYFFRWFAELSSFYRHIKDLFYQLSFLPIFWPFLAYLGPFFRFLLTLGLSHIFFFNWFWPFVEPWTTFRQILDHFYSNLTLFPPFNP